MGDPSPLNYDVVIAGGGIIGSAIAYFLASDTGFGGSLLVIERDPSYANCAATRSWGGLRQQFSTPENVRMSQFGVAFVRRAADLLDVDGDSPDLAFREQGYLFLASAASLPVLEENCRRQQALGAHSELLDLGQLARRFPWVNRDGLAGAAFGARDEGWIDAHALLQGLRRKAQALGAVFLADEAVDLRLEGRRAVAVCTRQHGEIGCGLLVNAAGPQAWRLAARAGVDLPVRPRKRMTFVFDCREDLSHAPLTADISGVVFRPEGQQYLGLVPPPADRDPDCDDLVEEYGFFEEVIWPTLAHRYPAFEAIKMVRAWAGHYDFNCFDQNAILGPHPAVDGLLFCNGFSGHGVQQAPAAGRAMAELIIDGRYRSLDLSRFVFDRILEGRPLLEANVL